MKIYSLSQQSILEIRQRSIKRKVVMFTSFILLLTGASLYLQAGVIWVAFSTLLLGFLGFRFYQSNKQLQDDLASIRIELGDDYIAYQQNSLSEKRIRREEIESLRETNQGLLIYTADKYRSLGIPIELDDSDYQEIKTILSGWGEIR